MFRGIKNTYKKSEAAVIVENLLQLRKTEGAFYGDPASEANNLIKFVYEKNPERFNGNRGLRPHKLTFAAQALANALKEAPENSRNTLVFMACLEQVLQEVEKNQVLYPFNQLDEFLLREALNIFEEKAALYNKSPAGKEMNDLLGIVYPTWDEWYAAFKIGAGEVKETLPPLIDFMDHAPLKMGFKDGADPMSLGREFAEGFDVTKFGMPEQ